jgi:hypothetical protein
MSLLRRLAQASTGLDARCADPWRKTLEGAVQGVHAMSSVALLDLVGARSTTGNARRLAAVMRELGFVPLKSRRLEPGGWRGTTIRGWALPCAERTLTKVKRQKSSTPTPRCRLERANRKDTCHAVRSRKPRHDLRRVGTILYRSPARLV